MTTTSSGSLVNELLELENLYWRAMQDGDSKTAMRLSADPCIVTGAQGVGQVDRKTMGKLLDGAKWKLDAFTLSEPVARALTDDVAVIAYKVHEELTVDGKAIKFEAADSSTWVRREGEWVCAVHTEALAGDPFGRDRTAGSRVDCAPRAETTRLTPRAAAVGYSTAMDTLTLYVDGFWNSPYVFSVFVALTEKGLPFTAREVNLHERAQAAPSFQALSVTGRVPVLEHGAFQLSESSAIVEYLEETFAPPAYRAVLPTTREARARARQIMAWLRSDLMPIREERPTSSIFYEPARAPLSDAGQAAARKLVAAASAFIPDGRTSLFDELTVADADLAMMLQRLLASGYELPPKLTAFVAAQWQRPSVRAFVERPRPPYIPY